MWESKKEILFPKFYLNGQTVEIEFSNSEV